jgi:hypothetical protein
VFVWLCVGAQAMERCADSMEMAADWLLANGMRELDRMANDMMRASALLDEQNKMKELGIEKDEGGDEDSDSENDLTEWLLGSAPGRAGAGAGNGGGDDARGSRAAETLDDDLEMDVPVGIERQDLERDAAAQARDREMRGEEEEGKSANNDLKVDEVIPGMLLTVADTALSIAPTELLPATTNNLLGRTGVVVAANINSKKIQVNTSFVHFG